MDDNNVSSSGNIDFLNIPENDRRILEILALKKEQEKQNERLAHQSQLLWEKSQRERIKVSKCALFEDIFAI